MPLGTSLSYWENNSSVFSFSLGRKVGYSVVMTPVSLGTAHKHIEVVSPNPMFSPPAKAFKDLGFFIYIMGKLSLSSP